MKLISWQYLLTDHQVFTWRELQRRGHQVHFILGKIQDENRKNQGWNDTSLESLTTQPLPVRGWWNTGTEIILNNSDAIHIFSGFWADKRFFLLILFALSKGIRTMLMNEAYAEVKTGYFQEENKIKTAVKVYFRPLLYKTAIRLCHVFSRNNPIRVLAIGPLAEKQFLKAGVSKQFIFPWGYFIPKHKFDPKTHKEDEAQKIIYIGHMQHRKGLDLAIQTVDKINHLLSQQALQLDIYGSGNPNQWIPSTALGITYKGVIPFGHSQEVLTNYSFLILPSRHDGWGVVVNEALLQGVPVILSDKVGARTLLDHYQAGLIFQSENEEELTRLLLEIIREKDKHTELAKNADCLAKKIQPSEAANYLEKICNYTFYGIGEHPSPNWD